MIRIGQTSQRTTQSVGICHTLPFERVGGTGQRSRCLVSKEAFGQVPRPSLHTSRLDRLWSRLRAEPERTFMREYLTEAELSEMIAVPRSTLRWRRYVGLGPTYVKFGRSVRYPVKAVREFIQSNIHTPDTLAAVED